MAIRDACRKSARTSHSSGIPNEAGLPRLAGAKGSECRHSLYASRQWRDCRSIRPLCMKRLLIWAET